MKKVVSVVLFAVMLTSCGGNNPPTWQEQYDLGLRYLSEGSYEEAIIAFAAAIEIDSKQAPAYIGRGDAYSGFVALTGKTEEKIAWLQQAAEDYQAALELGDESAEVKLQTIQALLEQLQSGDSNVPDQLSELELTGDTKVILDEFYYGVSERNYSHLGDFVKAYWVENQRLCIDEDQNELWGVCYDGEDISWNYTGIGLKIINEYCWYYGPLENGIPQGEGISVGYRAREGYVVYEGGFKDGKGDRKGVLVDVYYDEGLSGYFTKASWDGTWERGYLDGEAIITSFGSSGDISDQYKITFSGGKMVLDDRWIEDNEGYMIASEINERAYFRYNSDIVYKAPLGMFDD